jgi:hypothetical protein
MLEQAGSPLSAGVGEFHGFTQDGTACLVAYQYFQFRVKAGRLKHAPPSSMQKARRTVSAWRASGFC